MCAVEFHTFHKILKADHTHTHTHIHSALVRGVHRVKLLNFSNTTFFAANHYTANRSLRIGNTVNQDDTS